MNLLDDTLDMIARVMLNYRNPCVLWSSGKDSMVMLHLIRTHFSEDLPVVCYREPWFPSKQRFTNRIIDEWQLQVWDYAPSAVALCRGKGRIDVMQHYQIGKGSMILARGTEPPVEGEPWLCGVDTFLQRPLGAFVFPWDVAFHGHKSTDEDPTSGTIPLSVDVLTNPGSATMAYPLRHWTHRDVFDYIRANNVPFDETRYDAEGNIFDDKTRNPDYYSTCFACCDPDGPEFVHCPKLERQVNNISSHISWIEPTLPYCGLRTGEKV